MEIKPKKHQRTTAPNKQCCRFCFLLLLLSLFIFQRVVLCCCDDLCTCLPIKHNYDDNMTRSVNYTHRRLYSAAEQCAHSFNVRACSQL